MKRILLLLLMLMANPGRGDVEDHGCRFAEKVQAGQTDLNLNGVGLLRYKYIFKLYVAALYLGNGVKPQQVFEDVPKRLEIAYLRTFTKKMIVDAGDDALAENVKPDVLARIRPQVDQLNAFYEDVKEGDRYALTYIPGVGTELSLNGARKGVVEGAEFASEYFKIWLGRSAIVKDLKAALLAARGKSTVTRAVQIAP